MKMKDLSSAMSFLQGRPQFLDDDPADLFPHRIVVPATGRRGCAERLASRFTGHAVRWRLRQRPLQVHPRGLEGSHRFAWLARMSDPRPVHEMLRADVLADRRATEVSRSHREAGRKVGSVAGRALA